MSNYGLRFPRSEREAFQALANPCMTPRQSRFAGEFRRPLGERLLRFIVGLLFR